MTVTLHDLQDLRRRVLLDRRSVEEGYLDGADVLTGVIEHLDHLIAKKREEPPCGWRDALNDINWYDAFTGKPTGLNNPNRTTVPPEEWPE